MSASRRFHRPRKRRPSKCLTSLTPLPPHTPHQPDRTFDISVTQTNFNFDHEVGTTDCHYTSHNFVSTNPRQDSALLCRVEDPAIDAYRKNPPDCAYDKYKRLDDMLEELGTGLFIMVLTTLLLRAILAFVGTCPWEVFVGSPCAWKWKERNSKTPKWNGIIYTSCVPWRIY